MPDTGKENRRVAGLQVEAASGDRLKLALAVGDVDKGMFAQHTTGLPGIGVAGGVLPVVNRGAAGAHRLIARARDLQAPRFSARSRNWVAEVFGGIFCHDFLSKPEKNSFIS